MQRQAIAALPRVRATARGPGGEARGSLRTPLARIERQKGPPPRASSKRLIYEEFGAGDGIRTHDPNLGKVGTSV
jgi:hypothetical protein